MSMFRLLAAELWHRKLNVALSLLALVAAATLFVASPTLLGGYRHESERQLAAMQAATASALADMQAETDGELKNLQDKAASDLAQLQQADGDGQQEAQEAFDILAVIQLGMLNATARLQTYVTPLIGKRAVENQSAAWSRAARLWCDIGIGKHVRRASTRLVQECPSV